MSISAVATLLITEVALRLLGYVPGKYVYSPWIKEVDSLQMYEGFYADSNGIFKVSPKARRWIDSAIAADDNNAAYKTDRNVPTGTVYEVYSLHYEYLNLLHGNLKNDLQQCYNQIKKKKQKDWFDSLVAEYVHHPVNEDGFRSVPFKNYARNKIKVLLIGDSFTWGHSAYDITNSFADILLSRGYVVYNTGVSGADPAQYLSIAQQYIPLLKPDLVIINFYSGNDVIYYNRQLMPAQPLFYTTNAGNIISHPQHVYFQTPSQAYQFAMLSCYIPLRTPFNRFCAKTVVGTLVWKAVSYTGYLNTIPVGYDAYYEAAKQHQLSQPAANREISEIKKIAEKNNAKCAIVFIPELKRFKKLSTPNDYTGLTLGTNLLYPDALTFTHYKNEDGHFNDDGHKAYADFLEQVIKQLYTE